MQKFTRALTREIEVGGERLAVTLSEEGLTVRPVGARRPPYTLSWAACICTSVGHPPAGPEPTVEELSEAIKALKAGNKERPAPKAAPAPAPGEPAPPPAVPRAAAAPPAPAGEDELKGLLHRVDAWLAQHRKRFHDALLPGASPADLDGLQQALGGALPQELRTWLGWHNGQNPDVMGAFEGSFNLLSAHEIADAKKQLDAGGHEGWQRGWIPFLDDDHGNYLVLDASGPTAAVRGCWRGQPEHAVVAPSLAAWVKDFLDGLERGAYTEDPERGSFLRR